jgi:hypothetical protein
MTSPHQISERAWLHDASPRVIGHGEHWDASRPAFIGPTPFSFERVLLGRPTNSTAQHSDAYRAISRVVSAQCLASEGGETGTDTGASSSNQSRPQFVTSAGRWLAAPHMAALAKPRCTPLGVRRSISLSIPADLAFAITNSGARRSPTESPKDGTNSRTRPHAC